MNPPRPERARASIVLVATTHPFQGPLDALPDYLTDARNLFEIGESARKDLGTARRAKGNATGAGSPPVGHKSINRAVVVAAVGALEAFNEDLALTALPLVSGASTSKPWFEIDGRLGMVQTPSPWNIAKMHWVFFRYDPRPDWDLLITTAWSEKGPGTNWRGTTSRYGHQTATSAEDALNAMVKVRHGFAHQDATNRPPTIPGVVSLTPTGKLSLQSHHAFNAMSMVAQVAIQTTHGLAGALPGKPPRLKWRKAMTAAGFEQLLADTPVAKAIRANWSSSPF